MITITRQAGITIVLSESVVADGRVRPCRSTAVLPSSDLLQQLQSPSSSCVLQPHLAAPCHVAPFVLHMQGTDDHVL